MDSPPDRADTGTVDRIRRAVISEPGVALLGVIGLLLTAIQTYVPELPGLVGAFLLVIGTGMIAVASARVGHRYLADSDDRHAKAFARLAFGRSRAEFRRLRRLEKEVAGGVRDMRRDRDGEDRVALVVSANTLNRIGLILESGVDEYDNTLAVWEEIIPEEARETRARLAEES